METALSVFILICLVSGLVKLVMNLFEQAINLNMAGATVASINWRDYMETVITVLVLIAVVAAVVSVANRKKKKTDGSTYGGETGLPRGVDSSEKHGR